MRRMMMSWCDCVKLLNLLTPSCCPFPRAKAEEELWTHSNEQSEVAQREAPKGPSKNKSWPWQKHREEQKTRATEADLSDEEHMLSSCKSPNRGLETFKRSEKRKHKNGTQVVWNASHMSFTVSFLFGQGTAFLAQRWPPAVVCALAASAWCAHAHWSRDF